MSLVTHPAPLYEVNVRCLEALVRAAQGAEDGGLPLVNTLRDLLMSLNPDAYRRVAHRAVLLTDIQFSNDAWWRSAAENPRRPAPLATWHGSFPRKLAIPLARATLTLSWHALRASPADAVLLGIGAPVADLIATLSLTDIENLAELRFRHVRPRWEDRPEVWRTLLQEGISPDYRKAQDFSIYLVQLLTAELMQSHAPSRGAGSTASQK
jgi:hypothetical protein